MASAMFSSASAPVSSWEQQPGHGDAMTLVRAVECGPVVHIHLLQRIYRGRVDCDRELRQKRIDIRRSRFRSTTSRSRTGTAPAVLGPARAGRSRHRADRSRSISRVVRTSSVPTRPAGRIADRLSASSAVLPTPRVCEMPHGRAERLPTSLHLREETARRGRPNKDGRPRGPTVHGWRRWTRIGGRVVRR